MALHIQNAPRIFTGRNILDMRSPIEKENIRRRKPPGRFQSIIDQPTPRCPNPERLPMANAPSPSPAAATSTVSHRVDIFLMKSA